MPERNDRDFEFSEYRRLFVSELERLDRTLTEFAKKIDALRDTFSQGLSTMERELTARIAKQETELALLKFKVFLIGFASATIGSAIFNLAVKWLAPH